MTQIPDRLEDVGKGWHPILLRTHEALVKVDPGYVLWQVKEKFGSLRIYLGSDPPCADIIAAAEDESRSTCEWCGQPGTLDESRHWLLTLCPGCTAERATKGPVTCADPA